MASQDPSGVAPADAATDHRKSAPRLSKSRYMHGLQCERRMWWQVHEPDAPELASDPATEAVFRRGHEVGERAREAVPGGVLIPFDHERRFDAVRATRDALDGGARVLYEASFDADRTFAAIDILERNPRGWTLTEVKSTLSVKPAHLPDVALQTYVARASGIDVTRTEVMHLDRRCRHPRLERLFTRVDVTGEVEPLLAEVPARIRRHLEVLAGELPDVAIGRHCDDPYACPFKSRCWPARPAHAIEELYARGVVVSELRDRGYATIHDIPADEPLKPIAAMQRDAVKRGAAVVADGLAIALRAIRRPVAFLDFETIAPAIPVWAGCRPYGTVPVQFSVHRERAPATFEHVEHLAEGPGDPRPALARALLDATRDATNVLAWSAGFEHKRILDLAQALPEHRQELRGLAKRLVDLLRIVRGNLYHPDFRGSFSLKQVAPALVPDLAYDDLDIADGTTASAHLEVLLLRPDDFDPAERERLRAALLRYCERDTAVLVAITERLHDFAAGRCGARAAKG
jgi:hypothetical protein